MRLKHVFIIALLFALGNLFVTNLGTYCASDSNTIYITPSGSIVPSSANITTANNIIYTFTGNVNDSIVVQRDNIVIEGAGYLLNGTRSGTAISLEYRSNVTIKNIRIQNFYEGLYLYRSSRCNITGNTFTDNRWHAIELYNSQNNTIQANSITANQNRAIIADYSSNNKILDNTISGNYKGIEIDTLSDHNMIWKNSIIDNDNEGITIEYSKHNSIIENNVTANRGSAISIGQSGNTTINGNRVANNLGTGIVLTQSSNCTTIGNEVTNNSFGIDLRYSNNTLLKNNAMTNNTWNFVLDFFRTSDFINDVETTNTINGKPIYYWIGKHNQTVPTDAGMVIIFNCTGITLQSLNISDRIRQGAVIAYSTNTTITDSYINSDEYCTWLWNASNCKVKNSYLDGFIGIQLTYSTNNTVYNNTITGGGNMGAVALTLSSDNTFYHNNFTNNYIDAFPDEQSINNWDNGYPDGGNYWDNYVIRMSSPTDAYSGPNQDQLGPDGYWDRPYPLNENNTDRYPIVPEYTSTIITIMITTTTMLAAVAIKRTNKPRPDR